MRAIGWVEDLGILGGRARDSMAESKITAQGLSIKLIEREVGGEVDVVDRASCS